MAQDSDSYSRMSAELNAGILVALIRNAYTCGGMLGEEPHSEHAALIIGRQILPNLADDCILRIARGEATLTGTLASEVTYAEVL